ncbi:hypothetical protein BH23CHL2_BH23CHL2_15930 [soil metagenome]
MTTRHKNAPAPSPNREPARDTVRVQTAQHEHNRSKATPAQITAWRHLWQKLLAPVESEAAK